MHASPAKVSFVAVLLLCLVAACESSSDSAETTPSGAGATASAAGNGSDATTGSATGGASSNGAGPGSGAGGGGGSAPPGRWVPPVGIPAPPYGIEETHEMYSGMSGYQEAGNGPYTHYVEVSSVNGCSDTGNPNGSPASPRCTVPSTLAAGSVVELHGGPYVGQDLVWNMNGTADAPVFVRGVGPGDRPVFSDRKLEVVGSYFVLEHLDLDATKLSFEPGGTHASLRHSYVHDHPGTGAFVANMMSYVVIYENEITRNGVIPSTADHHGFFSGAGTHHIWVVDNHMHHNSGDSIQFCHGCWNTPPGPGFVYIGRNLMHEDEENAIDIKEAAHTGETPVVISQNTIFGYQPSPNSNGDAIRINDEGEQEKIWILLNHIYDATLCIQPSNSHNNGVFVIGNVMHDCDLAVGPDALTVVNNTIANVHAGVESGDVHGNLLVNASVEGITEDVASCSGNLAWQASIAAGAGCSGSLLADPGVVFTDGVPTGVQASSPAVDASSEHPVYALFESLYALDIRFDATGAPRPQGAGWDIGAHEQ